MPKKARTESLGTAVNAAITVGSKSYPCRITMGAMRRFKKQVGYDVNKLKSDNTDDLITFLWCCVSSACAADGIEFDMDVDLFADCLSPDELNSFFATSEYGSESPSEKKI